MARHLLLVAFTLPAVAVAAPVPKTLKNAGPNGTWEVVEQHSRGNKVKPSYTTRWTIDGDKLSIERVAQAGAIVRQPVNPPTYSLVKPDPAKPAEVDYTITYENGARTRTYPGRLEVEGDTMRFCYEPQNSGTRPAECKPTETNVYYEFRRVAADGKDK
jgi:uncharacterized protein (TIGR03067 family)